MLMPKRVITKLVLEKFKYANIKNNYYEIGTDFEQDLWADVLTREIADIFDVSIAAVKIRLKNLNLLKEKQQYTQFSII